MYNMIHRILSNYEFIEKLLDVDKNHRKYLLSIHELDILNASLEVLEPFMFLTEKLSGEKYSTLNMTVPAMCLLLNKSAKSDDDDEECLKSIFRSLIFNRVTYYNKKFKILNDDHLVLACFLNPKTKHFPHAIEAEKHDLQERVSEVIKEFFEKNKSKFNHQKLSQNDEDSLSPVLSNKKKNKKELEDKYSLENSENEIDNKSILTQRDAIIEINKYFI